MPDSKVYLGHVPFDSSYRHTILFGSAADQATQMLNHMNAAFSDDDYTFIREGASIRVSVNADQLNGYNYCMYNNGNKWYYNFITRIVYINEATSEIQLQRDVMQTWWFDFDITACFVEREHVADDTRYAHTMAEPYMPLEQTTGALNITEYDVDYVCVYTTACCEYYGGVEQYEPVAVSGGMYDGSFSAAKCYLFRTNTTGMDALRKFLDGLNTFGSGDAIVAIFLAPSQSVGSGFHQAVSPTSSGDETGDPIPGVYALNDGKDSAPTTYNIEPPASLDGYTPRNNKLYSYPFTYAQIGDFTGKTQDLRFELSQSPNNRLTFQMFMPTSPAMQGVLRLTNYQNSTDTEILLTVDLAIMCPWTYDTFANWYAQNDARISTSVLSSIMGGMTGVVTSSGIPTVVAQLGSGLTGGKMPDAASLSATVASGVMGAGISLNNMGLDLMRQQADIEYMQAQPNQARGNVNGDARVHSNTWGWWRRTVVPRSEYAKAWDDFFDAFGYEVDEVKVPELTSRPSWNYVKTRNAGFSGNVNLQDMAVINSIFDSGVTLWHTWDVGNYSLANGA